MRDVIELIQSLKQLNDLMAEGSSKLVDVRDKSEFDAGHLEGAVNVPLTELAPLFDNPDQAQTYIFICESGVRSLQAANFARIAGLKKLQSVVGGMTAMRLGDL